MAKTNREENPQYSDELLAIKLDKSKTVRQLVYMHTNNTDYIAQSHSVPSPNGKRVIFGSNWEVDRGRPVHTYVVDIRGICE